MIFHTPTNEQYILGREIGRGGEGTVYEVQGNNAIVLKHYNDPLTPTQANKLKQMVAMRTPAIETYSAWPTGLVLNNAGEVCGFVMKKLTGFVPLHTIFSPMDRKKMFPDKGYNFLVHVARNLATAFFKLHEAGLVVGDVNEGNILINAAGLVSFIDCDSFQVKDRDNYFFCEVGVPRYTPPELLREKSFESIVRTVNTDSFSLAVLIFQLLFLGRHPFAGRNRSKIDIDEETAIKQHEFAYSLNNQHKKLLPPNDSFPIANLSDELITFFHQAFEQENRPLPADWVKALDTLLGDMITCAVSRIHTYPGKLKECPWCKYRQTRGILYFLDDSYLKANAYLSDIENFVNGFKLDNLELKKWSGTLEHPELKANPIPQKFKTRRHVKIVLNVIIILLYVAYCSLAQLAPISLIGFFFMLVLINYDTSVKKEIKRMQMECHALRTQLQQIIHEYNNPPDLPAYTSELFGLNKLVNNFRHLPDKFDSLKKTMEEQIYDEQLHYYLHKFDLEWYTIPSIGAAKKTALSNSGIKTAADITQLKTVKVPGIGPKNFQILLDWQRQMASGFVYIPDNNKIAEGMAQVNKEIDQLKLQLESNIRKSYQSLTYLKLNITNRAMVLEKRINEMSVKTRQAELDLKAFEQFRKII